MSVDKQLSGKAKTVLSVLDAKGLMLATVESCTGGLIAASLTEIAGSSSVVDRGFVTYSNEAKTELVGVPADLIDLHGAVSEAVARAMAEGGLLHSRAQICVSVTGIAGPGGGTPQKPVGTVHIACARLHGQTLHIRRTYGERSRSEIRAMTVLDALELVSKQAS